MTSHTYEFDSDFQTKIMALTLRDADFNARVEGLIDPSYFAKTAEAIVVSIVQTFYAKYRSCPTVVGLTNLVKDAIAGGQIRKEEISEVKDAITAAFKADISDKNYVVDVVAEFAKHQAIMRAMEKSVDFLSKRKFSDIEKEMSTALRVGAIDEGISTDVFSDIAARTHERTQVSTGVVRPSGISTGYTALDACLQHGGYGRRELTSYMGPAKVGKSFSLMNAGVNAALAGQNVLHVSLENSVRITADRIDSYISGIKTKELMTNIAAVEAAVKSATGKAGAYKLHQFPASSFKPKDLRRLMESYRAKGVMFDLVVIDYADIMAPDQRTRDNPIEDSKSVYLGIRDVAVEYDCAVVTATQTNREGAKAHVATAVHVAEDYNRVRICDLVISINRDDDERLRNEARLYFAAGRNQEDGYTIQIKQDLSSARFIDKVMGISRS